MRARSILRRLIGVWLMVDGVTTGMWFATLADSLESRGIVTAGALVARLAVAALSVVAGWLITQRRPPGGPLGQAALVLVAVTGLVAVWSGVWRMLIRSVCAGPDCVW